MGIKFSFCCCGPYFLSERLSKEDSCHEKASSKAWIAKTIKQTFLLRKKKKKVGQQQLKMGMEFKLTLEEWLLKSPIMEKDGNYCNGEHCGFKHQYGSDYHCPSLTRKKAYFSDSGVYSLSLEQLLDGDDYTTLSVDYSNISLEKLLKDEKVDGKEDMGFNKSLTRSQSSKVKKRVSFRLPEVSDIIILYPSDKVDFKE